ncbi:RNA-binding domain superfamily [Arabidopsis suecica]|uniref:RNA-binding domain superfamily n=1 Tax=Arabidopsis suecica TaxID=45249 RepID=A0A8T1Z7P3_ARASU|nr:RNA-binding domain superfamily [Arabidopsis suecica]
MEESAIKGLKLLELNDSDAKTRSTRTKISVEGYDTRLREYTLKLALEKHFASCGKITTIYVPRDYKRGILKNVTFMWIKGDDAEEKALQLSGTDVGGWTALVKPAPWQKDIMDPWCPAMRSKYETQRVRVTGYDTWLPEIDIQIALCEHFSSCGEVTQVMVLPCGSGSIYLEGERCEDKALKLNGCNMGGMNLVVEPVKARPEDLKKRKGRPCTTTGYTGYMPLSVSIEVAEEKKKKIEMEVEMEMDEKKKKKKMKMELMKVGKELKKHMEKKMKIDMSKKKRMKINI